MSPETPFDLPGTNEPILVVDGNNLAMRAFHGFSRADDLDGDAMTIGFFVMLRNVVRIVANRDVDIDEEPVEPVVVVAWDAERLTRRESYPEYKAGRASDEEAKRQLVRLKETCKKLGLPTIVADGWEADDLCASVARSSTAALRACVILSSDKDCLQAVSSRTSVLRLKSGTRDYQWVDAAEFRSSWGLPSGADYLPFAAMCGDKSDNLPGIPGIGPKRAMTLINADLTDLEDPSNRQAIQDAVGEKLAKKIEEGAGAYWRNLQLMKLYDDLEWEVTLPRLTVADAKETLEAEGLTEMRPFLSRLRRPWLSPEPASA